MIVLSVIFLILGVVFFVGLPGMVKQNEAGVSLYEDGVRNSTEHKLRAEEQSQAAWQQQYQQELDRQREVRQLAQLALKEQKSFEEQLKDTSTVNS